MSRPTTDAELRRWADCSSELAEQWLADREAAGALIAALDDLLDNTKLQDKVREPMAAVVKAYEALGVRYAAWEGR